MQILKCLLVVCAAVSVLPVRGADNDVQKKAREALEKKMNELQGQAPRPAPSAPVVAPPREVKPPAPAPAPTLPPPVVVQPAPADSDAIAKAREAMRQKMQEVAPAPAVAPTVAPPPPVVTTPPPPVTAPLPTVTAPPAPVVTTPPPTVTAPPPPVVITPPPAPAVAPFVTAPPAVTPEAVPAIAPPDSDAIAKAREAMRQKMQDMEAQPTVAPSQPAPPVTAPAPPVAVPAPAVAATPPAVAAPAEPQFPPGADPETIAKARDAMRLKLQQVEAQPPAPAETVARISPPPPGTKPPRVPEPPKPVKVTSKLSFPQLEAPPLPINADKQQQLNLLLQKYRADEISPEQYHAERAKILGGQ